MEKTRLFAIKNKHERDSFISFNEKSCTFTIDNKLDCMSITTWNNSQFKKFNADEAINEMMASQKWSKSKYFGKTREDIKKQWENNWKTVTNTENKIHCNIDRFYNNIEVNDKSIEYNYFKNFYNDHKNLKPYRTRWIIYDRYLKIAGLINTVFIDENENYQICDWKRCKEIKKINVFEKSRTDCISQLDNCNFSHYSLELNTCKYLLEKNYGIKISKMFIVCIHPDNQNKNYIKLEIPNLNGEITNLMELKRLVVKIDFLKAKKHRIDKLMDNINKKIINLKFGSSKS